VPSRAHRRATAPSMAHQRSARRAPQLMEPPGLGQWSCNLSLRLRPPRGQINRPRGPPVGPVPAAPQGQAAAFLPAPGSRAALPLRQQIQPLNVTETFSIQVGKCPFPRALGHRRWPWVTHRMMPPAERSFQGPPGAVHCLPVTRQTDHARFSRFPFLFRSFSLFIGIFVFGFWPAIRPAPQAARILRIEPLQLVTQTS